MLSRRTLLLGSAALAVSGCAGTGTVDWAQVQAKWNEYVDSVTALVAKGCNITMGFIPTVTSIAAAVAAIYGPAASATVGSIIGSVAVVANALCSAIPPTPPANLSARLRAATPAHPTVVGTITVNGQIISVSGYGTRYGVKRRHYGNVRKLAAKYNR
jgi:hypothetical protein